MTEIIMTDVLLVEDNPTDAEITMRAFKKYNLTNRVVWVKDGVEALEYLFSEGRYEGRDLDSFPRVILLDLHMPRLDGLGVLKAVRQNERTKLIPVVILTSSKEDRDIVEGYSFGANSYVSKPVEFESFMKKVVELGMYWVLSNHPPIIK